MTVTRHTQFNSVNSV